MMYLNVDLRPGPHLRTLLVHEYTHAVVFSEHLFGGYPSEGPAREEESWLNEGLAHLAGMSSLKTLVLWSTQVTDAGLAHLEGLV